MVPAFLGRVLRKNSRNEKDSLIIRLFLSRFFAGEWPSVDYTRLIISDYLAPSVLESAPLSHQMWLDSLKSWHRQQSGLDACEARLEFMRLAQYLGMYGVSYFPAKYQGLTVWIGVHPKGSFRRLCTIYYLHCIVCNI